MSSPPMFLSPAGSHKAHPLNARIGRWVTRHPRLLIAMVILLLLVQVRSWWTPTPDATSYLSLARSVFSGHGITRLGSPELHYAPGYPLLISPLFLMPDYTFLLHSIARFAMAAAFVAGVFLWAKTLVPRPAAIFITLLVAGNFSFWRYYRVPLSELPMMMFMVWAALAMRKLFTARTIPTVIGWCIVCMLLLSAAAITRQSGFAVGAGMGVAGLIAAWRKQLSLPRILVSSLIICVPCLVGLFLLGRYDQAMATAGPKRSYLDVLHPDSLGITQQITNGLHLRISEIGRLLIPGMFNSHAHADQWLDPNLPLYLPLALLVLTGWWMLARRFHDPLLWAAPFYAGLYILWPFDQDTRFFTPLLPVLCISLWPWIARLKTSRWILLAALCVLHLGVSIALWTAETRRDGREYRQIWPVLTTFSATVAPRPGPSAAAGLSQNTRLWWQYILDRRVEDLKPTDPIPPTIEWLLQPAAAAAPAGFQSTRASGPLRLLHRAPPTP